MDDLAPQHERLHHVRILMRVRVRQSRAVAPAEDGERVGRARLVWIEALAQPLQHGVAAVSVLLQERVRVGDAEDALAKILFVDARTGIFAREERDGRLLRLDVALDLRTAATIRRDHT